MANDLEGESVGARSDGEAQRHLPVADPATVMVLQDAALSLRMNEPLVDYIQALVRHTRESPDIEIGLSPRGAQALAAAARAHAFVERHSGVFPDDVQAVFAAVAAHRLKPAANATLHSPEDIARQVLAAVAIP